MQREGESSHLDEIPVDAIADAQCIVEGLDVDVAGAVAESVTHQLGDHVDDGAVVIVGSRSLLVFGLTVLGHM